MKKTFIMLLILAVLGTGCSQGGRGLIDVSTSYFNNYTAETSGGCRVVRGELYQAAGDDNGRIFNQVEAERDTLITVTGTMRCQKGNVKLVYTAPDGTQTVLAESGEEAVKTDAALKEGTGTIGFAGDGKEAVCTFELMFEQAEGVAYMEHTAD